MYSYHFFAARVTIKNYILYLHVVKEEYSALRCQTKVEYYTHDEERKVYLHIQSCM